MGLRDWIFGREVKESGLELDQDPLIVTGVTSAMGGFGSSWREPGSEADEWRFAVHLVVWRTEGGQPLTDELRLERSLPSEIALDRWTETMPAKATVRFRLLAPPQPNAVRLIAQFGEYLGRVEDAELEALADRILHPPPFVHPQLGRFTALDDLPDLFEGKVDWRGARVNLTLAADGEDTLDDRANTMLKLLADADRWQAKLADAIHEHLYELWDSTWREESQGSLSRSDWLARLRLIGITVSEEQQVNFEYHDGDLFWGHHISAFGSLKDGIKGASI